MQFIHETNLDGKEYVKRQEWFAAPAPSCQFSHQGRQDCVLAPNGTYARVEPAGMRVRRFICPATGRTVSMLPRFLNARMTGTLHETESAVRAVESAVKGQAGSEDGRHPPWRALHPAAADGKPARAAAMRWNLRRLAGVALLLQVLRGLQPDRFGGCDPTLASYSTLLGTPAVPVCLRSQLREHLHVLPAPAGFVPVRLPAAFSVNKKRLGGLQHSLARPPPAAAAAEAGNC